MKVKYLDYLYDVQHLDDVDCIPIDIGEWSDPDKINTFWNELLGKVSAELSKRDIDKLVLMRASERESYGLPEGGLCLILFGGQWLWRFQYNWLWTRSKMQMVLTETKAFLDQNYTWLNDRNVDRKVRETKLRLYL